MYTHPELMFIQANERQRELEAEASRYRLLAAARRGRRRRRELALRQEVAGTLAPCTSAG